MNTKNSLKYISSLRAADMTPLTGAGSSRRYYRHAGEDKGSHGSVSVIVTDGDNISENRTFTGLSKFFASRGVRVPEVLDISEDYRRYVQQDLGDVSLLDVIRSEDAVKTGVMMRKAIDELVRMQTVDMDGLSEEASREGFEILPEFDRTSMRWDLDYFKYEFLKPSGIDFNEWSLEDEFERLLSSLTSYPSTLKGFMMRDFQSRNVMVSDNETYLIDFQGGRPGPVIYDIISLLWQARAGFDDGFRHDMLEYYARRIGEVRNSGDDIFSYIMSNYDEWALLRMLQVLGAYGLRGLVERKAQFVESIPSALMSLRGLLSNRLGEKYPYLCQLIGELSAMERFKERKSDGILLVNVLSFSYKKGYPEDLSGNGGGFMFDCRGMHNPGRYNEYKSKTGRDCEVIRFLEERGEVHDFLRHAEALVFPVIERYVSRGFTSLQIGFGCTGGQHRSVYCAQRMAEKIAERFGDVRVLLVHREQGITERINF